MTHNNNRIISKRLHARPKGRNFYPVSLTLTQEQIDFLQQQPNASELIRKILNDLIAVGSKVEEAMPIVRLNNQLKELEARRLKISDEQSKHWRNIVYLDRNSEERRIGDAVQKDYEKAINLINDQIAEIKKRMLSSQIIL